MLNDKNILITGGTGSFGKSFIEYTLKKHNPNKIIVYSRDEFKQEVLRNHINEAYPEQSKKMRYFIGDVRDRERLYRAFDDVHYVIHAAAMKQVPTCEYNPFEAVKTNIYGAQNVIDAAIDNNVLKVVALSTDKAVNPINLYGGTKLVSDKLFISANSYSGGKGTVFSVVRYGNVAGSRGSVIPFFADLIQNGATELPITHLDMTRFWITLEEGIELVYKALEVSNGGETYISKIPSFKVTDLAHAMLDDYKTKDVGIREGEKIHEIMITKDDARLTYEFPKYYVIYPNRNWWNKDIALKDGGRPVNEDFEYVSNKNSHWLKVSELKEELHKLKLWK